MRYLRSRYDRVLIDTPPITSVSDPIVIASLADAVLFVLRQDFAAKKIVSNSIAALNRANMKPVINVVNDFGLKKMRPIDTGFGVGLAHAAVNRGH